MLETVAAQLRYTASVVFGLPFSARSLDRLVDALLATYHEFGVIAPDGAELLSGPALDEETRREMQLRRFRAQTSRAARETPYYRRLFEQFGLDPARLRYEDIQRIPLTPKKALRDDPDAFVRTTGQPCFRTTTTGTTGRPTSVCFSQRELHSYIALGAINHLMNRLITPEDIVLISTSARATLGNTCFMGACARIGAQVSLGGLVEPELTLALLAEPRRVAGKKSRVSGLSIYPSYLGQLVTTGLQLGYRPADFGVERIFTGGEIVTAGLKARCQQLFGAVEFVEGYGMTELWPFGGSLCAEGHLHFEPAHGLLELLNPLTGEPARAGEVGTLVQTPFPPFRETTLVLRYDTQDAVRALNGPLTCALRHMPATSNLLGKLRMAVQHDRGWVFPRDVLEALESIEDVPLPARCGFWAVPGGVAVEVVAHDTPTVRSAIEQSLQTHGVPLEELHLVEHQSQLRHPLPLRGDLRELSFSQPLVGHSAIFAAEPRSPQLVEIGE
ncbi:MAG TPA: AMP-binding protein [Roseiflexaceae bacterium]|nr:AMP-binding protein [Roseiflexaceae bacterium]